MKTYELLKISESEYQEKVFELWMHWCEEKSYTPEQFKKLSECAALCEWWKQNLSILEAEFREDAEPYHSIMTANDASKLYRKHVHKLTLYYSVPLIKKATNGNRRTHKRKGKVVA